jgi:hypothetical protein
MALLTISWTLSDGRLTAKWSEQAHAQPIAYAGSATDSTLPDNRLPLSVPANGAPAFLRWASPGK